MDPEQLMLLADQALADGNPLEEVIELVRGKAQREGLGGDLGTAFRNRVESRQLAEEAETISRVAERGKGVNAAIMALNALTFGQMGSVIDLLDKPGTSGEVFREAVREIRETQPVPAAAAELGGGVVAPGGGIMALGRRGGRAATVAGGAVAGGGVAGLMGFGEASGTIPERISAGAEQAPAGMLFGGGVAGVLEPFSRTRFGRAASGRRRVGPRIAGELEETTGLSRDINTARATARAETERVSQEFFAPLDEQFPAVTNQSVREFMEEITKTPDARSAVRAVSSDLLVPGEKAAEAVLERHRPPSFSELRKIRDRLWKNDRTRNEGDELQQIMLDTFPGFREGNAAFRAAKDIEDALALGGGEMTTTFRGERIRTNTPANVQEAFRILPPESHEAFRTGLLQKTLNRLVGAEAGAGKDINLLRSLIDDVNTEGRLRRLFPADASAEEFVRLVRAEASGRAIRRALRYAGI